MQTLYLGLVRAWVGMVHDAGVSVFFNPHTGYNLATGSISKVFAMLTMVHMRDAGKLDFDDEVAKFVPEFGIQSPFPVSCSRMPPWCTQARETKLTRYPTAFSSPHHVPPARHTPGRPAT